MFDSNASSPLSSVERQILEAIRSLKFGEVAVTVHDARVVQLDKTEKRRFEAQ